MTFRHNRRLLEEPVIVVVIGLVLTLAGTSGHPIRGRRHFY
ncbi:DUF6131 family protein [Nocardia vinacea]